MFTAVEKSNIINTINSNKFSNLEYNQFYKIINNDTKSYSKNKNGIFVNSKNLSDNAYKQLDEAISIFFKNKTKDKKIQSKKESVKVNNYSKLDYETSYDNLYYKLSNYEKNVIKKNKYYLNNDSEEYFKTSDEIISDDTDNITRYKT